MQLFVIFSSEELDLKSFIKIFDLKSFFESFMKIFDLLRIRYKQATSK